jgi:BASS family bile acid:Na+ symporter
VTLWTLIVIAAFYSLREPLVENFKHIGLGLLVLPIVMMLIGLLVSRIMNMSERESKTVGIELTIQNSPMALALAAVISGGGLEVTELAIPAAVYSATMYLVAVPCIFIFRSLAKDKGVVGLSAAS